VTNSLHRYAVGAGPNLEERDEAILRCGRTAGGGLIGEQVALPVHDRLSIYTPDGLDDVHVLADDRVDDSRARQRDSQAALEGTWLVAILVTPVHAHHDHARP